MNIDEKEVAALVASAQQTLAKLDALIDKIDAVLSNTFRVPPAK